MPTTSHTVLDPAALDVASRYKLMTGTIVPRPIGFISSISAATAEKPAAHNLAPYSFFNGVSSVPMCVQFCPANKPDGSMKDSLINALPVDDGGTGEFVANIVSEAFMKQMARAGEALPLGQSEFEHVGLTAAESEVVKAPRLAEALVSYECITKHILQLAPGEPAGGNMVIGEVVRIHVAQGLINDRFHTDTDMLAAVGRMGGFDYVSTTERVALKGDAAQGNDNPFDAVR